MRKASSLVRRSTVKAAVAIRPRHQMMTALAEQRLSSAASTRSRA
ncbi:MAG TPA: hypothetical protein VF782_10320 [Allosphingosinicella sp.]